jgi:DNA-binding beta-propeller fold protein YncE
VLDSTGFDIVTSTISPPPAGSLCPQQLAFTDYTQQPAVQRIELGQGTLNPVNFFASPDGTQLYIVNANSSSIVIYSFISGSVIGGIELAGGVTPLSADMSVDGATIAVAGSDGMLHEVSTSIGGSDLVQLSFPNLPNFFNAFCSAIPASGTPCILNSVLVRP